MPVAFDGTNTRVGRQLDVPVQSVRATEDPSTTTDHLPPIESLDRCVGRDTTSPRTMVPEFHWNTTADSGAADHVRVVGVDVTPEVDFAGCLANVTACLANEVTFRVDRVVVGLALSFSTTSASTNEMLTVDVVQFRG